MGNPNSKVDNEVQVVNIQEALARHEDTKQEKYMMQPGSNMEMSQVSFHSDTFFAILLTSAAIVMLAYILYSCLKRGTLCPRGFLDVHRDRSDLRYRGRLRYKRGDEEDAVTPAIMMYPSLFPGVNNASLFPSVNNVGKMAAAIEVPTPSAPDQIHPRQFSQARSAGPDTYM